MHDTRLPINRLKSDSVIVFFSYFRETFAQDNLERNSILGSRYVLRLAPKPKEIFRDDSKLTNNY